jgi:hypothetical protein
MPCGKRLHNCLGLLPPVATTTATTAAAAWNDNHYGSSSSSVKDNIGNNSCVGGCAPLLFF